MQDVIRVLISPGFHSVRLNQEDEAFEENDIDSRQISNMFFRDDGPAFVHKHVTIPPFSRTEK